MNKSVLRTVGALILCMSTLPGRAGADDVDVAPEQHPLDASLNASAEQTIPGTSQPSSSDPGDAGADDPTQEVSGSAGPVLQYRWVPACGPIGADGGAFCAAALGCPNPEEVRWSLHSRTPGTESWELVNTVCYAGQPPPPPADGSPPVTRRPQVTPAVVLREVRTIGLPTRRIQVQPADTTLVNLETIFYTTEPAFNHTTRLLGYDIDIIAHPARYTWHTGDGETLTTTTPGAPYPQGSIVHRYHHRATNLHPRLHITYQIRFRVNDRNWQTIDQTLTTQGPPTTLTIKEATPLLTS